ncbi:HAD family hydrolase [Puteibacter caeruleilacunae]|nr:HAD family hydrolase [Puteibacter caeruleilacunae]
MERMKAVIFDLDGTIGNTLPLCIKSFKNSIEPLLGRSVSEKEIVATFGRSEEGTIMALVPNDYEKGIADYLHHYKQLHEMCPAPFDGIIELLNELIQKEVRLAMVTGKGKYSTEISLEKFDIDNHFEIVETGHAIGDRKTEGIKSVLDFFNIINKDEVIYVGDSPSDILVCKEVGIPIAAAAWADTADPEKLMELGPEQIFYTINDFSEWLGTKILD